MTGIEIAINNIKKELSAAESQLENNPTSYKAGVLDGLNRALRSLEISSVNTIEESLFEIFKYQNLLIASLRRCAHKDSALYQALELFHHFSNLKEVPFNNFIQELILKSFLDLKGNDELNENEAGLLEIFEYKYNEFLKKSKSNQEDN